MASPRQRKGYLDTKSNITREWGAAMTTGVALPEIEGATHPEASSTTTRPTESCLARGGIVLIGSGGDVNLGLEATALHIQATGRRQHSQALQRVL